MKWYLLIFKKYAQFSGRSRRKEYWYMSLFNNILGILTMLIDIPRCLKNICTKKASF